MSDAKTNEHHVSVLLDESVDALRVCQGGTYVDATFGRGGHTRAILLLLGDSGRLIAFDKDPQAIAASRQIGDKRFEIVHSSYADMASALAARGIALVDGALFDLGISSPQIDDPQRGFSFRSDGPLDMRMDTTRGESAADFINRAPEQQLAQVIRDYGEERFAVQVAKAIVARRALEPFARTLDLAQVVARAVKTREKGQDPATRTFQALRIHVNQELEDLSLALEQIMPLIVPGGRLVVISFHSLEDRIVKRFMQSHSRIPARFARMPLREHELPQPPLTELVRVLPGSDEVAANPRARSAVLRAATRTSAAWNSEEARR